ncbi:MAG: endonuclease/exonuclease/phosphatase family protein [Phenylobacterium sp.]
MRFLRIAAVLLFFPPVFLLALLCAGASGAAQFGRTSLLFDILTHFAPLYLAGAVLALAAAFAFRGMERLLIAVIAAIGVLASASLIAPELVRSTGPRAKADAPHQLKIIQFNVWAHSPDILRSLDWIERQDADIVVLEEADPDIRALIEARTKFHIAVTGREVMILSRAPPLAVPAPLGDDDALGTLSRATFTNAVGGVFSVVGVHHNWPTDGEDQQKQEARVARVLRSLPKDQAIVAGDFNSTPWSFSRRRWDREFGLIRRDRALFTWPAQQDSRLRWLGLFPILPIDHVYAGPGWATVKVERGPRLGSDHYPVIVTLAPVAPR